MLSSRLRGHLLIILVLLTCVSACSTKMSYYFIDWAIKWQLDDYVELNDKQQQALDAAIAEFILWHQAHELPKYNQQLNALKANIGQRQLTADRWHYHSEQGKQSFIIILTLSPA